MNNPIDDKIELRVLVADDVTDERIPLIVQSFAEIKKISDYSYVSERDSSLVGGVVIFCLDQRYDYSVKGQLDRIKNFVKRTRSQSSFDGNEEEITGFSPEEIKKSIHEALSGFDETPAASLNNDYLWSADPNNDIDDDEELLQNVRKKVQDAFKNITTIEEVGVVYSLSDGVAIVKGLDHCMASELIVFAGGAIGIAMNLEQDQVGVVLLTGENTVNEGTVCTRTETTVSVPVGHGLLGRVVDPLGNPIDGKGMIRYTKKRTIEYPAPTIVERSPVNQPLHTGITAIDALTPIGRGQRELIIGDRQTGKTAIALDTIINQRGKDVLCVYVAIGQKMSTIVSTVNLLEKYGALDYTVVVAASSSQSASLQYIAPFSGCAVAEEFMYEYNKDVLIVYDDLSKHAQAYRAISLLLRRPPGREAYPGDVFYLHSRLLERSAKLSEKLGGGSITALPIIETLGDDISAYIPTNVISITDGQIYLAPELFFSGQRPAVNVGLSVSRVGGAAQCKATKKVGGPLRIALAQAREMASFAQFGSDLDENTRTQLKRGIVLNEVLKQGQFAPYSMEEQVVLLYMATSDSMNFLEKEDIKEYFKEFLSYVRMKKRSVYSTIANSGEFSDSVKSQLDVLLLEFKKEYISMHPEYQEQL